MINFEDLAKLEKIYTDSGIGKADELFKQHKAQLDLSEDLETQLPEIIASLPLELKEDNKEDYDKAVKAAQDFLQKALELKSPAQGQIILASFKEMLERSPEDKKVTVCDPIAKHAKSILFLESSNEQSKLWNVMKHLVEDGTDIQQNDFTKSLLRMLTADSVNIMHNLTSIKASGGDSSVVTKKWKEYLKSEPVNGGDSGHHHW